MPFRFELFRFLEESGVLFGALHEGLAEVGYA